MGISFTFSGSFIRVFLNEGGFWLVLLGGFVSGIGKPFIANAPAKISGTWFKDRYRVIMTAILATVNPLGCGIGFIVPVLLVPDDESLTIEEGKDKTKNLMVC